MTRKTFVKSLATAAAAPLLAGTGKRNIIFILTDDHRYDMFGALGHPWLKTPNLDRLIHGGVLFQNAFVTTSLCSPSRASILTGQYVHSHQVADNISLLPKGLATFPVVLQQHGYKTGFIGKWHMGGSTDQRRPGFDRWVSFRGQGVYYNPNINFDGHHRRIKGGYITDILTDEAVKFIDENKSSPFMLYLSHKAVHSDFYPAQRHKDWYSDVKIPYPKSMANTEANYRGRPDWVRRQRASYHGVDGMYDKAVKFDDFYRDYARTLMAVDDSVGRVRDELEARGLLNDTLIIYMGDNGFLFGDHGLIDKRCMYEPSMRVPMIAHCPDLFDGGRRREGMALNIDIAPTILDAAGAPLPQSIQGRSLLPLIAGAGDWRKEFVYEYFWERDYPQTPTVVGLRTDRYSFMRYHGIWDRHELYDIQNDPDQMNNLLGDLITTTQEGRLEKFIHDPDLKKLVGDLVSRIATIMEKTNGRMEPRWRA